MILCLLNKFVPPDGHSHSLLARTLRRHREACPSCEHFTLHTQALENSLRTEKGAATAQPSQFLKARILRAVQNSGETARPAHDLSSLLLRFMLPAVTCAAVVLMIAVKMRAPDPQSSLAANRAIVKAERQMAAFASLNMQIEDPLTMEMNSLVVDSRNAVRTLAANFLPGNPQ